MRNKVDEEINQLEYGDRVEVKWLDASRFTNAKHKIVTKNKVFATYKKIVGWFYFVKLERLYKEPYMVIITEKTNGRINIVSIPLKVIMKVTLLSDKGYGKEMNKAGTPYLAGGYYSKFRQVEGGVGEIDEEAEHKVASGDL